MALGDVLTENAGGGAEMTAPDVTKAYVDAQDAATLAAAEAYSDASAGIGSIGGALVAAAPIASSLTVYLFPMGLNPAAAGALGIDGAYVMPKAGVIRNLHVMRSFVTGVTRTDLITLYKNGVATTVTFSIAGAATTGNDVTHSFSVVAGDAISFRVASGPDLLTTISYAWSMEYSKQ